MLQISSAYVIFLQKFCQALSGLLTAILVTQFLSQTEQGYYYVIGSMASAYVLVDLGFSGLLVQLSARMFSGLEIGVSGSLEPSGEKRDAYLAMLTWVKFWYKLVSLFVLLFIPVGFTYFYFTRMDHQINWQPPLVLAVITAALSMSSISVLSVIEGTGRVAEVYWIRTVYYLLGAFLAWILIANGYGLYSPAMPFLAVSATTFLWMRVRYPALFSNVNFSNGFSWRFDVWRLQKSVAVSSVSGYLFLNFPTLIVFYYCGSESAGQLGLTTVIANLIGSLCASSLTAAVPSLTALAACEKYAESRALFITRFKNSFFLISFSYTSFYLILIEFRNFKIFDRLLLPLDAFFLLIVFIIYHSAGWLSLYFRALGRDVLSNSLLISTVFSSVTSFILASYFGMTGVMLVFLAIFSLFFIPAMFISWQQQKSCHF